MSGGAKQSGAQTVTSTTQIPPELKPLVNQSTRITGDALSQLANRITGKGKQRNLVAGFDPLENEALQLIEARARGEGGFIPTAQNQLLSMAQGNYLYGGDGFNAALDASMRRIQPQILSRFGGSGRGTGGLAQTSIAQANADAFAGLYDNERQRQMAAISALPAAATLDTDMLMDAGGARRGMAQQQIDAPMSALERLIASAQGTVPAAALMGSQSSQPIYSNRAGSALGGIATGLGIGSMMAPAGATGLAALGGPVGIGLGAAGGLLGGLF